jgi:hypothetical protein
MPWFWEKLTGKIAPSVNFYFHSSEFAPPSVHLRLFVPNFPRQLSLAKRTGAI